MPILYTLYQRTDKGNSLIMLLLKQENLHISSAMVIIGGKGNYSSALLNVAVNLKPNIQGLNPESFIKERTWDSLVGFPWVAVDKITGCLAAAREFGEKGQCHHISGMNIWSLREGGSVW